MHNQKWKKVLWALLWFGLGFGVAVVVQIPYTLKQRMVEMRRCLSEMYHIRRIIPNASAHTQDIIDGYITAKEEALGETWLSKGP